LVHSRLEGAAGVLRVGDLLGHWSLPPGVGRFGFWVGRFGLGRFGGLRADVVSTQGRRVLTMLALAGRECKLTGPRAPAVVRAPSRPGAAVGDLPLHSRGRTDRCRYTGDHPGGRRTLLRRERLRRDEPGGDRR